MNRLILLVDDDQMVMRHYRHELEDRGIEVVQLSTPDDAIEYVTTSEKRSPDLIILDMMLPVGRRYLGKPEAEQGLRTGAVLYSELRQQCGNVPIFILTNVAEPSQFESLTGVTQILSKLEVPPFELADLVQRALARGDAC